MHLLLFILLVAALFCTAHAIHYNGRPHADNWVVRLRDSATVRPVVQNSGVNVLHTYQSDGHSTLSCVSVINGEQLGTEQVVMRLGYALEDVIAVSHEKEVVAEELWNLDRIDQRNLPLNDGTYNPAADGSGVHIYVVDTGIDVTHLEFGGRASNDFTVFGLFADEHGHGTHVAGIAGGASYGVARGAWLHNVRVLDATGSGSTFTVALGLLHILSSGVRPGVINLSLGYMGSDAVIASLIADLQSAGFTVVAAAGNSAADSCNHEPSSLSGVIAMAASTIGDVSAAFNNVGSCVTLHAPGVSILSAAPGQSSATFSGTSMAAPHATGAVALKLQFQPSATPAQIKTEIEQEATPGVLSSVSGSPNLLLYIGTSQQNGSPSRSSTPAPSTSRSSTPAPQNSCGAVVPSLLFVTLLLPMFLH